MKCHIAHALEAIGDEWSILIIRDAVKGMTRYDEFRESLGISPTVLSRRLNTMVNSGIFEKRLYSERPPRHEYILTPAGRELEVLIKSLERWGFDHVISENRADDPTRPSESARRVAADWFHLSA